MRPGLGITYYGEVKVGKLIRRPCRRWVVYPSEVTVNSSIEQNLEPSPSLARRALMFREGLELPKAGRPKHERSGLSFALLETFLHTLGPFLHSRRQLDHSSQRY